MISKNKSITIIGAGIGGLCSAIALQKLGYKIKIYEKAEELIEIGAGLTIPPNARNGIKYLGLEEDILKIACQPQKAAIKDYHSGKILSEIEINQTKNNNILNKSQKSSIFGTLQIHRADFQTILVNRILKNDPNCIFLDHELTNFNMQNNSVISCDGNKSLIRETLHGNDKLNYLGYVAWRGLIPIDNIPDGLIQPDTATFIGKNKIFARYKVRSGKMINYVAFSKKNDWKDEGWTVRSSTDELFNEFSDSSPEINTLINKTPPDQCFKWALVGRDPIKKWSIGNVSLLGDAAHPMLPFLGQGAAMAIEDAVILSRYFTQEDTIKNAFKEYEQKRMMRTSMVTYGAEYNGLKLSGVDTKKFLSQKKIYTEEEVAEYNPASIEL
jgi:salicylate hydroxylase